MENVIELDNVLPRHTFTFLKRLKKTVIRAFIVLICTLIFAGGIFAKQIYAEGERRYVAAKQTFILSQIEQSLLGKKLEFDHDKRVAIAPAAMSRDDLLRVLYKVEADRSAYEAVIEHLKDTLSFE